MRAGPAADRLKAHARRRPARSASSRVSLLSSARVNRGFVMRRCLLVLLAALSVLILPCAGVAGRLAAAELQPLEIASKNGVHVFAVEMASTPEEQAKGLMFRRQLPEGQGMRSSAATGSSVAVAGAACWRKPNRVSRPDATAPGHSAAW